MAGICDRCGESSSSDGKQYGMFWICDTCENPLTAMPIDAVQMFRKAEQVYRNSLPKIKCPNCGHQFRE